MPLDMEQALAQLRAQADTVTLPPPDDLRHRGDRRRRGVTLAGTVALILLVGASTVGTVMLLGSGRGVGPGAPPITTPAPPPAPTKVSTDPSVAPPDSGQPGAPTPGATIPYPDGCIGDNYHVDNTWPPHTGEFLRPDVMLDASDFGRCYIMSGDIGGFEAYGQPGAGAPRPDVCRDASPYDSDAHRTAGWFRAFQGEPQIGATEAVTRYEPGYAEAFLDEIALRVAGCVVHSNQPEPGLVWGARVVEARFAGDESLLIYVGTSRTEEAYPGQLIAVVRVGDTVAVIEPWIDLGSDHALTVRVAQRAAQKMGG